MGILGIVDIDDHSSTESAMDYLEEAKEIITREAEEISRLAEQLNGSFKEAVDLLKDSLANDRRIVVVGVGKSGNIGHKLSATLNSTGAPSMTLNAQDALHGDLGIVCRGDCVIALSQSGETEELLKILPHLIKAETKIIGITGDANSTLAKNSDVILPVTVEREACPMNLAPTSSTTKMLVLCDALAMVLLQARGFGREDFARLHPGGSLGANLLTRVSDVMRGENKYPAVSPESSVQDTLEVMNNTRCGAAAIVDSEQSLLGIFTHGDFVRAFRAQGSGEDISERAVQDFMTEAPITIRAEQLAADIYPLLEDRPVDDIIALNEEGKVVGLVDTQDLSHIL